MAIQDAPFSTLLTLTDQFGVIYRRANGALKQMSTSEVVIDLTQIWGYYTSFDKRFDRANKDDQTSAAYQNSGAYVFRPSTPEQQLHVVV